MFMHATTQMKSLLQNFALNLVMRKRVEVVLFKLIPFVLAEMFSLFVFFMFAPFSF